MLKVHMKSGTTLSFDLEDVVEYKHWKSFAGEKENQMLITGLSIINRGISYSLPTPNKFVNLFFMAEYIKPDTKLKIKGGEKIFCLADNIRISMMVHAGQKAARVFVENIGRMRYNPNLR